MDVEMIAVSAITSAIARCPHLRASITANDKTPFTDGYIDLHSSEEPSKANWIGRTTVQVKGRSRTAKKPLTKFKVAIRGTRRAMTDVPLSPRTVTDMPDNTTTPNLDLATYAYTALLTEAANSTPLIDTTNDTFTPRFDFSGDAGWLDYQRYATMLSNEDDVDLLADSPVAGRVPRTSA